MMVGDSLLLPMAMDTGLEATAWDSGWDVYFKRGGHTRDIRDMVRGKKGELPEYEWVLLCGGSNSLQLAYSKESTHEGFDQLLTAEYGKH